ncbi:ABC transporter ATP-binding protein [Adhaeribacter radiodurans]|uniref:ABC transporter ATP-binding protein n=1 Tax=Adhaeribacter radiodurans TaxID=2745197 RepID=A0A7L7L593_9BACT|nr:ABC transporter ATP-binding protein [Adhaeribacter radiodurans]QMU27559.1 ABC transporter ATP-binding protein [Adhaeribacter radiodurans]
MSDIAIKVENLGKLYRLGEVGTGTLSHDLNRWWARMRGKEDPFAKIGETNDRTKKGSSDYVWSLKDVNFEVKQGEVLGIIGRNGAGKSTLLKILSKVTSPTTGRIKVKGRIASLLEVGTGFHPELTGRENIFLNGAILGMTKAEIRSKFDEIVDFSGVERYIDTPVKRYSSGMYVRLAFAVSAFLEPEILIVDEVLAVGDAEFQKKCLGRMKDVSVNDGRTVLFVSHNMAAIQNLCTNGLYMKNGQAIAFGEIDKVITTYLSTLKETSTKNMKTLIDRKGNGRIRVINIVGANNRNEETDIFLVGEKLKLKISFDHKGQTERIRANVDIGINNNINDRVAWMSTSIFDENLDFSKNLMFEIEKVVLTPGIYNINVFCNIENEVADWIENVYSFEVVESDYYLTGRTVPRGQGYLVLDYKTIN